MGQVADRLVNYASAPFASSFAIQAILANNILAANLPYEGLWVPVKFAKQATVELTGSISSVAMDIWGTNQQSPLNTYNVTVGGSETDGDVLTLTFTNPLLPGGSQAVAVTAAGGEGINAIAAALAAAVAGNANLAALGFQAAATGAAVKITWPSTPGVTLSQGPAASDTLLATTLSGGATETLTVTYGSDGTKLNSTLTALGLTAITPMPVEYVKARVTTLTGGGANVSAALGACP